MCGCTSFLRSITGRDTGDAWVKALTEGCGGWETFRKIWREEGLHVFIVEEA